MTHFAAIAVLDVWPLSASLRSRMHLFDGEHIHHPRIVVRDWRCPACGKPRGGGCARDEREPRIGCYLLGGPPASDQTPEWQTMTELEKWPHLRNVLSRIMRLDQHQNFEMGRVTIEMLEPGGVVPWHQLDPGEWQPLHLPIVTNPRAMMYADCQSMHLTAGVLTWVSNAVLCSETNLGATPRIHLVLEVRAKPQ